MSLSIVTSRLRASIVGTSPQSRRTRYVRARNATFGCYLTFASISFLGMLGVLDRAPAGVRIAATAAWFLGLIGTIAFAIVGRLSNDRLR